MTTSTLSPSPRSAVPAAPHPDARKTCYGVPMAAVIAAASLTYSGGKQPVVLNGTTYVCPHVGNKVSSPSNEPHLAVLWGQFNTAAATQDVVALNAIAGYLIDHYEKTGQLVALKPMAKTILQLIKTTPAKPEIIPDAFRPLADTMARLFSVGMQHHCPVLAEDRLHAFHDAKTTALADPKTTATELAILATIANRAIIAAVMAEQWEVAGQLAAIDRAFYDGLENKYRNGAPVNPKDWQLDRADKQCLTDYRQALRAATLIPTQAIIPPVADWPALLAEHDKIRQGHVAKAKKLYADGHHDLAYAMILSTKEFVEYPLPADPLAARLALCLRLVYARTDLHLAITGMQAGDNHLANYGLKINEGIYKALTTLLPNQRPPTYLLVNGVPLPTHRVTSELPTALSKGVRPCCTNG